MEDSDWLKKIDLGLVVAVLSLLFTMFIGFFAVKYAAKSYRGTMDAVNLQSLLTKKELDAERLKALHINSFIKVRLSLYKRYLDNNIDMLSKLRGVLGELDNFNIFNLNNYYTINIDNKIILIYKDVEFKFDNILELINISVNSGISISDYINELAIFSTEINNHIDLSMQLMEYYAVDKSKTDINTIKESINSILDKLYPMIKDSINDIDKELDEIEKKLNLEK